MSDENTEVEVEVVYMSRLPFPIHLHGGPGAVGRAMAALDDMIAEADRSGNAGEDFAPLRPKRKRGKEDE